MSSASSQLAPVREQKERRALSWETQNKPDSAPRLASDETVVSSKSVLTEFRKVASRDPEAERIRRERLERYRAENTDQRDVYLRLKAWADSGLKRSKSIIPSWAFQSRLRASLPTTDELLALARHYYPPRVSNGIFLLPELRVADAVTRANCEFTFVILAMDVLSIRKSLWDKSKSVRNPCLCSGKMLLTIIRLADETGLGRCPLDVGKMILPSVRRMLTSTRHAPLGLGLTHSVLLLLRLYVIRLIDPTAVC